MSQMQQTPVCDVKWRHEDNTFRRFVISGVDMYEALRAKLTFYMPDFFAKYNIAWEDEEGDKVVIACADDLGLAIRITNKPVFRIISVSKGAESATNTTSTTTAEPKKTGSIEQEHVGVLCDGCDGKIIGRRFKCTTCPDFDLCGECERAGKHDLHPMLRIMVPSLCTPFLRPWGRCPRKRFEHHNKRHEAARNSAEEAATEAQRIVQKLSQIGCHVATNVGSQLHQAFLNLGLDDTPAQPTSEAKQPPAQPAPEAKQPPVVVAEATEKDVVTPKLPSDNQQQPQQQQQQQQQQEQQQQQPAAPPKSPLLPTAPTDVPLLGPDFGKFMDDFVVYNMHEPTAAPSTSVEPPTYITLKNMGFPDTPSLRALAESYPDDINAAIDIINSSKNSF